MIKGETENKCRFKIEIIAALIIGIWNANGFTEHRRELLLLDHIF